MEVCCGSCHVELKSDNLVVLDCLGILRHEGCYDYTNHLDKIDTIGPYKDVKGLVPAFMINLYREVIAMDPDEQRTPEEITDEEVIAILSNMFTEWEINKAV